MIRDFQLKVKALDDTGAFTGLASTYGDPPDLVGDVIEPNSFRQSIASQGKGYPLLWAHKQDEPLGLARVSDSAAGLIVNGELLMNDPAGARAHLHLKAGSIRGLSIGYTVPHDEGKVSYRGDGARVLKEIRLHEISLVAVPANPAALVTSVKSLSQVENLLRGFRPGDVKSDELTYLHSISSELKRLLRKDALCECDCPECLAGNCKDCSNPDYEDPNCEGSMMARQQAEEMAALKALALELKIM